MVVPGYDAESVADAVKFVVDCDVFKNHSSLIFIGLFFRIHKSQIKVSLFFSFVDFGLPNSIP